MSEKRFRIAFSFAGEKRDFVAKVAALLSDRFGEDRILYDKYHEAEFARVRLGRYLPSIYHDQAELVVVVLCKDYAGREWPGLEWDAVFDLIKQRKDAEVMLCRFDRATVEGIFSDAGYVELDDKTPQQAFALIVQRLAHNEGKPKNYYNGERLTNRSEVIAEHSLSLLKHEFEIRPEDYVALMHVKLDWLEGSSDPTRMKFKKVAGPGVSQEVTQKGGEDCSLFPGISLNPEFWLSSWSDNEHSRFYPNRRCKHWVTINDGSIDSAISTWKHFTNIAERAGDLIQSLGLRTAIDDPLQRWLVVLHDTTKPERISGGMVDKFSEHNPLPHTMRRGDMLMSADWVGCPVIDDLHEASAIACTSLMDQVARAAY